MGITHIPQQVASTVDDATDHLKRQGNRLMDRGRDANWVRTVSAASLVTGAVLLASGKRKAGLTVAAAGTILALAEDPQGVKKVWNNMPDYLESGHGLLTRFEKFVGEITAQGEKFRTVVEKAVRQ
jgi:methionine synthase I (cobalamin-dependent)